jgi:DNA helicase-2/ATP-dependent DNA helicase PcrA
MKLVTAGPGAGKTRRLVSEIQERLDQGVSPYTVIATTFTREAAREIEDRLRGEVAIRTLHGLAYWIIRLSRQSRGDVVPRVISEERAIALMERASKELDIKFMEPRQILEDLARTREKGGKIEALHPQSRAAIDRYFRILSSENLLDFTGLLDEAKRELENPELRQYFKGQRIFVDEAQDVNPITEWPILDVLREGADEFVVFASPSQQIYGFRGADWDELYARFPAGHAGETMRRNHRSTPEIIHAATPLAGEDAASMEAVRASLGIPVLAVDALNPEMEADFVGRQIAEWLSAGIEASKIAVLARVHTMLNNIQMALRTRDIPFQLVSRRRSLFHREETQAVLGYLLLALEPMDDTVLEAIVNFPPQGIGARTRHALRGDEYLQWDHLFKALANPKQHRDQVIRRVLRILDLREHFEEIVGSGLPLLETVSRVIELSEIPSYLTSEGDFQAAGSVGDLVDASEEFGTLEEFVEYLDSEVRRPREAEGVQLSTLHSSKGREWTAVIVPGFQDGLLPLDGSDIREEQNLAFVGMTRARDQLILTMNRAFPPSPFLTRLPVQIAQWPLR